METQSGPAAPKLEIDNISSNLEALEETIIARLIDRSQFRYNQPIYLPGQSGFSGEQKRSLFHVRLAYQERMDAQFGRFFVPEERAFNRRLPRAKRLVRLPETGLFLNNFDVVNLMPEIVARYLLLVPRICAAGDDGHYGSSTEHDVYAVQAVSRRIHYGTLYIAESKFRASPDVFVPLIAARDMEGIIEKLTRKDVEERIEKRILEKVLTMQSNTDPRIRHLIDPAIVAAFYRETIVPLTKKGEALYLLHRMKE